MLTMYLLQFLNVLQLFQKIFFTNNQVKYMKFQLPDKFFKDPLALYRLVSDFKCIIIKL